MRELRLSSWTLSRGSRLLLCHKENVILTQGSPLKWVCPAVFTDHHHEGVIRLWWWEAMPVGALKLLMQKRKGKGRKLKASTEQIPRPGKLQLCWTAFSLPSHGPPHHNTQCTHTLLDCIFSPLPWPPTTHNAHTLSHPLGADPFRPQKPSPPSPPGKHRLLAEEGTWDLVTERNPVGRAGLT